MLLEGNLTDLHVYPAELKLFKNVDQPSTSFVLIKGLPQKELGVVNFMDIKNPTQFKIKDLQGLLDSTDYVLPISVATNPKHREILASLRSLPRLSDLENSHEMWLGRELDETNYQNWTTPIGKYRFIKGRDIDRFDLTTTASKFIDEESLQATIPPSTQHPRIAWRDVSRPNQKRRVIALGVLHFHACESQEKLLAALGLISSFVFEFQLRAYLATAHVSAGVMRKIRIPKLDIELITAISGLVEKRLAGDKKAEEDIEVRLAIAYGLNQIQFENLLDAFPKLTKTEKDNLIESKYWKK
jgi:Alw26I/Eco31I/Esp3I family type II restriction m6 adenine DNA methyltransferase